MTYRPGLYGMHEGGLKNPSASKAERVVAERAAKLMTKEELARHLSQVDPSVTGGSRMDYEFYVRKTKKELARLAILYHVHAFNLRTDNYD